jgi:hypothetical protein
MMTRIFGFCPDGAGAGCAAGLGWGAPLVSFAPLRFQQKPPPMLQRARYLPEEGYGGSKRNPA